MKQKWWKALPMLLMKAVLGSGSVRTWKNLAVQAADAAALTTDTVEKTAQESVPFYHGMINLNTFFQMTLGKNVIEDTAEGDEVVKLKNGYLTFVCEPADVTESARSLLSLQETCKENGAELYFLGTNARTAQGYHGNFYFDEFFWTFKFEELNKVASGMAMHKKWRKTYFSTPSTMAHEAYTFWTGERFNKGKPAAQHTKVEVSHGALQQGRFCEDRLWRQIVTILDAEQGGCDLFDIEELRREYSPEAFANLLMCEFVDDGASIFPLTVLQPCMVDSWVEWAEDYKPFAMRPFGDRQVWVGYDPAETGDCSGMVVVAPPLVPGGKFRVLERHQFRGMDFAAQASFIKAVCDRYWVTYIGIDVTGLGSGVAQLVRQFFPNVTTFSYSPEVKTRLVLKAYDVIHRGRLEFDAGWTDMAQSLMAIRKTITAGGRQFTYTAGRNDNTGHADLAWALFHALHNEPLEGQTTANTGRMEIF